MSVYAKWKRINLKNRFGDASKGVFGVQNEAISVKNVLPYEGVWEA